MASGKCLGSSGSDGPRGTVAAGGRPGAPLCEQPEPRSPAGLPVPVPPSHSVHSGSLVPQLSDARDIL